MTLHEAIQQVLLKAKTPLIAKDIAEILNRNSWYVKKDGSKIANSQIGARVKNYPQLFHKENGYIALKGSTGILPKKAIKQQKQIPVKNLDKNTELTLKVLMNEKNFKTITGHSHLIPNAPGLYCIRIKNPKSLQTVFSNVLAERKHSIIYIGLASKSLEKRFLNQELRAKGHGTFFRSLGAILGYLPEEGSLIGKSNQSNYKLSSNNEQKIIEWIDENLMINWVAVTDNLNGLEKKLINQHLPLLNIAGNPGALNNVSILRDKCKKIARG
ncbi:winged helix-turn-helix domain-containing protein [Polaribacter sp. MSW13]|uniref:Winged helix-turn-helix domain-containing protein n=1 Tax=Polaribacter marinus TaxID=2916838 RepID=A0A9X1VR98_9FLAO|nr:winged helix-turn-helix domain-containing protein [Polaribacter marinus]MCI2230393.1 winged helix-turn-helix domain-containing protein [Polaribacter marinus]